MFGPTSEWLEPLHIRIQYEKSHQLSTTSVFSTHHLSASSPPCLSVVASQCYHATLTGPPLPLLLPPGQRLHFAIQSLLHFSLGPPRGQGPTPLAPHRDTIDPPSTHQKGTQPSYWTRRSKPYCLARLLIETTASGSISS